MGSKKQKVKSNPGIETTAKDAPGLVKPSRVDPILAALFDTSSKTHGPLARPTASKPSLPVDIQHSDSDSSISDPERPTTLNQSLVKADGGDGHVSSRKRKRKVTETEIEDIYLQRLELEQARDEAKRKKAWVEGGKNGGDAAVGDEKESSENGADRIQHENGTDTDADNDEVESSFEVPQHESIAQSKDVTEIEKASRTVFLGNVSTAAIKSKASRRALLDHLASFFPELPDQEARHKVESLRFRSTAFATAAVPKKAAFAKKELMDATTQSTNAYAVYSTTLATREAAKRLNGTIVLDRHLRVDSVAHPSKVDHRRCVFVGNIGFVDDESNIKATEEQEDGTKKPRKSRAPADAEEGLWRQFGKAGTVESVRVVRDKTTRVGKGIAYVQFKDPNAVEKALLFNEKKYPPLLPRILRVTRAKNMTKTSSYSAKERAGPGPSYKSVYQPKPSSHSQSLAGRAGKLFGRAGAAHVRNQKEKGLQKGHKSVGGVAKKPESIVFEGHRANGNRGKGTLKLGKSGKKSGKATMKRTRRSAAFKTGGSKKRQT